jgi:hypothetical protein
VEKACGVSICRSTDAHDSPGHRLHAVCIEDLSNADDPVKDVWSRWCWLRQRPVEQWRRSTESASVHACTPRVYTCIAECGCGRQSPRWTSLRGVWVVRVRRYIRSGREVRVGRVFAGSGSQHLSSPRIHHSPKAVVDSSCSDRMIFAEADEHTLARSGCGHVEFSIAGGGTDEAVVG